MYRLLYIMSRIPSNNGVSPRVSIVSTDHCDDSISMAKTFLPIYLRNLEFQRIKAGQCIRKNLSIDQYNKTIVSITVAT